MRKAYTGHVEPFYVVCKIVQNKALQNYHQLSRWARFVQTYCTTVLFSIVHVVAMVQYCAVQSQCKSCTVVQYMVLKKHMDVDRTHMSTISDSQHAKSFCTLNLQNNYT